MPKRSSRKKKKSAGNLDGRQKLSLSSSSQNASGGRCREKKSSSNRSFSLHGLCKERQRSSKNRTTRRQSCAKHTPRRLSCLSRALSFLPRRERTKTSVFVSSCSLSSSACLAFSSLRQTRVERLPAGPVRGPSRKRWKKGEGKGEQGAD